MKSKKKIIQPLQTCIYIILILLAVVYIAPMLWVLLVSLKTNAEVMGSPFSLPEIYQWGIIHLRGKMPGWEELF